ncbi:hypothetical protein RHSIM_Rhsim13G0143300 [Rhododendron simsii]|uniref:Uncharacterized protein n=1 Tax=Rhododendron simsii TaxID=118357 RepID=A0A834G0M7_RHOSS|nr:hypothetical protein RHSIM_Rhsim13G0143300 [Rhododendron simsii]
MCSPYHPGPSSAHQRFAIYIGKEVLRATGLDDDGISVVAPIYAKRLSTSSSCAAVDSTIYCIGGTSSDLYASWLLLDALLRLWGLNGKIYVMGGDNNDEGDPELWAEVFDFGGLDIVVPLETDSGDQLWKQFLFALPRVRGGKVRFDPFVETSQAYFIQMPQMILDAVV